MMYGPGHMGGFGGFGGMGYLGWLMPLIVLLVLIAVIAAIVLVIRYAAREAAVGGARPGGMTPTGGAETRRGALDILDERYAKGEIDRDEFLKKKKDLSA